ncbi:MAG: hypothetical protein IJ228_07940 [Succinivibrio sp.]|nr:hypothetical protein [Succinivibrio sp.]
MSKTNWYILDFYNRHVIEMLMAKYGFDEFRAAREFIGSQVHRMLEEAELEMWQFSVTALVAMWESEKITGDPRNCVYLRP